jgi:signal transduction histidine kinase
MLFLRLPATLAANDAPEPLPLEESTARALERALLVDDPESRKHELSSAAAADREFAGWALRLAELRTGQTVNRTDEAVAWLAYHLVGEVAVGIVEDPADSVPNSIGWRLPHLATKLAANERRLAEFDRRLEHEKLESLKELAYGASHEINNPLANIAARAQTLLEEETNPDRRKKLIAIHRQAMRAHEMISDLMLFARPPKLIRTQLDLGGVVQQVVGELMDLAEELDTELGCETPITPAKLFADATQLGVALSAVIKNGLEATSGGGHVRVGVRRDQEFIEIVVADDGPGISDVVRLHMFDPFFSGREAGRGLGFGLSKCWRIVTDHGGQVLVAKLTGGAEIILRFPVIDESTAPADDS